ncbi:hypothetical protein AAG570_008971 [Ranatra chinensis]|uniref:Uncharacterized protein n=1 Tax=Ranatra chinensis TaxID=642074 RepID=A0ABD0YSE2_9HEMI
MASKRPNMFYQDKEQEATEIGLAGMSTPTPAFRLFDRLPFPLIALLTEEDSPFVTLLYTSITKSYPALKTEKTSEKRTKFSKLPERCLIKGRGAVLAADHVMSVYEIDTRADRDPMTVIL